MVRADPVSGWRSEAAVSIPVKHRHGPATCIHDLENQARDTPRFRVPGGLALSGDGHDMPKTVMPKTARAFTSARVATIAFTEAASPAFTASCSERNPDPVGPAHRFRRLLPESPDHGFEPGTSPRASEFGNHTPGHRMSGRIESFARTVVADVPIAPTSPHPRAVFPQGGLGIPSFGNCKGSQRLQMISIVNYIPSVPGFDSAWGGEIPIFAWRESRPVSDH